MKSHSVFICQNCGYESPKWMGKCPDCGQWNSLVETIKQISKNSKSEIRNPNLAKPQKLSDIILSKQPRFPTHIEELDRVLGGGIVPGSMVLVTGEPGIGKSTLLIQLAKDISENKANVLYVSGEESAQQIKLRADRLKIPGEGIMMLSETDVDSVIQTITSYKNSTPALPRGKGLGEGFENLSLIIIDSIQTLSTSDLTGTAGSVGQVKECTARLLKVAKSLNIAIFLVSHVTKEGVIAGPKVLEHLVDTVLYLEGEKFASARLLRATKNRFGATDEVGIFEMSDQGMIGVDNPSSLFLPDKDREAPGSVVAVTMEGTRPLLIEVQALAVSSNLAMPRRIAQGIDYNRFQLVTAILSKHLGLPLGSYDLFANVAGGLRIEEPALDLALALAIYSSLKNISLPHGLAVFGELGLLGEVRQVNQAKIRLKEAKRLGFTKFISPENTNSIRSAISLLKS